MHHRRPDGTALAGIPGLEPEIVFTLIAFLITWLFNASVDAQGGAYATGVLVLMTSASIAVAIAAHRAKERGWFIGFSVVTAVLLYVTGANVVERPDGVKIGACFIAAIILVSMLSRLARAFELRVTHVELDPMAERFVRDMASRRIRFIANEPDQRDKAEYRDKIEQIRADNDMPEQEDFVFVEVTVTAGMVACCEAVAKCGERATTCAGRGCPRRVTSGTMWRRMSWPVTGCALSRVPAV